MQSELIRIQVLFSTSTQYGVFTDAIYFTEQEYPQKTRNEIDNLKQARVTNYVQTVQTAPPVVPLTKQELEAAITSLDNVKADLQDKLSKLGGK